MADQKENKLVEAIVKLRQCQFRIKELKSQIKIKVSNYED